MDVFLLLPNKNVMVYIANVVSVLYTAYVRWQGLPCQTMPHGTFQSPETMSAGRETAETAQAAAEALTPSVQVYVFFMYKLGEKTVL